MNNISSDSRLSFFYAEKYHYDTSYTFDASCCPRPQFCMGFLINGKARFKDCTVMGNDFELYPGEIVFVPVGTRYIANWMCDPDITYISMHFLFDYPGIFSRNSNFKLQKLTFENPDDIYKLYRDVLENYDSQDFCRLSVLSKFFGLLSDILPKLETSNEKKCDERITGAVDYIEKHYAEPISVEQLAAASNMSVSRFFPCFKAQLGVTPVDYINHYRINQAIIMLVNNREMTIEQISSTVGFESSAYFRKVFKKITGKMPKNYRGLSAEV